MWRLKTRLFSKGRLFERPSDEPARAEVSSVLIELIEN